MKLDWITVEWCVWLPLDFNTTILNVESKSMKDLNISCKYIHVLYPFSLAKQLNQHGFKLHFFLRIILSAYT